MCGAEGCAPQRLLIVLAIDQLTVDDLLNYVRNLWVTLAVFIAVYVFMAIYLASKDVSDTSEAFTLLGFCLNVLLVVSLIFYHRNPFAYRNSLSIVGMGRDGQSAFFLSIKYPLFISISLILYDVAFFLFLVIFSTWYYYAIFLIDIAGTSCTAYVLHNLKRAIETDESDVMNASSAEKATSASAAEVISEQTTSNIMYKSDIMIA